MVIDKGLGLTETDDLLDLASDYVDYIKLTFGTSAFYSTRLLQQKITLVRSYGVDIFPGGTFLEIAVLQNRMEGYMERARELGFTYIEISDGTIEMSPEIRRNAIRAALRADLKVICEVGKKDPRENMPHKRMQEQIAADLEHGAYKVIVEGRESGKGVVIYDAEGKIRADELESLVKGVPNPESLIWEAPLKNQQEELIMRFGPNVSLGNIHPAEVLALEALRVGLRGDTLKACIRGLFRPVLRE
ncbi:MAG: phosphosulfolactate synthase [Bacillota bacterium]|nr:MAG: phosphosulfolactate synthase [Bacillota bacterium]MBS3950926.1 phosphosulfolactate synthase [Peptococcaceae bacterium]